MATPSIRDPGLSVLDIMEHWPQTVSVFIHYRMLCVGCAVAPFHTIEEACIEHGVDEATLRDELDVVVKRSGLGPA